MADRFRREMDCRTGKGGVHCYCCNQYTGKWRRVLRRAVEVGPVSILGRQVVLECLQGNKAKPGLANIVEDQLRKALVRYLSQHVLGGPK